MRAEKAHVEQLHRQVEFAQQEAGRLHAEYRDQSSQLAEVQSSASAARAQYGQLLQQHDELKQASTRLQQVHDVLQDRFAALTKVYDKLRTFLGSMDAIGHSLDKAQDAYKKACDQLVNGKANLVKQVSDFRQLGVAVKGELNEVWLDRADLELNLISQVPAEEQA
ncbi:TPA: DNA recombination protein RmuC [Pseudomonas aeruginosa]|nr:DNA recombination protein RmuC [Pseudomonas aeruginosa]HCW1033968.1 DNA recombination protein RmuC [Pseudomonas aeruginosa]HCW1045661.1 DNA recombination protein RmuC [Pseudomonas aeruginosa]HDY5503655.1 DNA recombination protein RmuC [Pseudomonas aeruginosa]